MDAACMPIRQRPGTKRRLNDFRISVLSHYHFGLPHYFLTLPVSAYRALSMFIQSFLSFCCWGKDVLMPFEHLPDDVLVHLFEHVPTIALGVKGA